MLVATTPTGANEAASKSYVDGIAAGATWLAPVCVINYIGNLGFVAINNLIVGVSLFKGYAYVLTDSGDLDEGVTVAVVTGDTVEFDGTQWRVIIPAVSSAPPAGARLLISTTVALVAPLTVAADEGRIALFAGLTLTPGYAANPTTGDAVLVNCDAAGGFPSTFENNGYSFQGAVPTGDWVQFIGAIPIHSDLVGLTTGGTDDDSGHTQMVLNSGRPADAGQTIPGDAFANPGGFLLLYGSKTASGTGYDSTGQVSAGSDFYPVLDSVVDIGASGFRFSTIYGDAADLSSNGNGGAGLTMSLGADILATLTSSNIGAAGTPFGSIYGNLMFAEIALYGGDGSGENLVLGSTFDGSKGDIQIESGSSINMLGSQDIWPTDATGGNIGRTGNRFATVYGNSINAAISCVPDGDNGADLGLTAQRWANLYVLKSFFDDNMTMRGEFDFVPQTPGEGEIGTLANKWGNLEVVTSGFSGDMTMRTDSVFAPAVDEEGTIGVAAIAAVGTINFGNNLADGDVFTIGSKSYLIQAALTDVDGNIQLGGSLTATYQNILDAINLTGTPGTQYATSMTINPDASASTLVVDVTMNATAKVAGTAGNSLTFTETAGFLTMNGGGTLGGTTAGVNAIRFTSVNAVDGNFGDLTLTDPAKGAAWRIVEEPEQLVLVNENNGRQFKMLMEELAIEDYVSHRGRLSLVA